MLVGGVLIVRDLAMAESLRALLEPGRQNAAFMKNGVADVELPVADIHHRLAAMHRGLVAHDALNQLLEVSGCPACDKLLDAIASAHTQRIITDVEARWLRYFNKVANDAKHHCMTALPF